MRVYGDWLALGVSLKWPFMELHFSAPGVSIGVLKLCILNWKELIRIWLTLNSKLVDHYWGHFLVQWSCPFENSLVRKSRSNKMGRTKEPGVTLAVLLDWQLFGKEWGKCMMVVDEKSGISKGITIQLKGNINVCTIFQSNLSSSRWNISIITINVNLMVALEER